MVFTVAMVHPVTTLARTEWQEGEPLKEMQCSAATDACLCAVTAIFLFNLPASSAVSDTETDVIVLTGP